MSRKIRSNGGAQYECCGKKEFWTVSSGISLYSVRYLKTKWSEGTMDLKKPTTQSNKDIFSHGSIFSGG